MRRQLLKEKEKKGGRNTNTQTPQITTQGCRRKKQKKQEKQSRDNTQLKAVKGPDKKNKKLNTRRRIPISR